MLKLLLFLSLSIVLLACATKQPMKLKREGKPDMYGVEQEDPEMSKAIEKARESFGQFETALKSKNLDYHQFAIKIPFEIPQGKEHIWMSQITLNDGKYFGVVNNYPEWTDEVQIGDTLEINPKTISDWKYLEGAKLHGGFSIRLFYDQMTPEEQKQFSTETGMIIE